MFGTRGSCWASSADIEGWHVFGYWLDNGHQHKHLKKDLTNPCLEVVWAGVKLVRMLGSLVDGMVSRELFRGFGRWVNQSSVEHYQGKGMMRHIECARGNLEGNLLYFFLSKGCELEPNHFCPFTSPTCPYALFHLENTCNLTHYTAF